MSVNKNTEKTKRRPIIFVVIGQLDVGGAETHLARVLPELSTEDYEIVMFVFSGGGALEESFRCAGIQILSPPYRRNRLARLAQCTVSLLTGIMQYKPSVMHFFLPEAYILGSIISLSRPGVVRIMSRRSLNKYQQRRAVLAKVERLTHRLLFGTLANSTAVSLELRGEGILQENIGVIYNGVFPHELSPRAEQLQLKASLSIEDKSIVLVCVANLIPYKGHRDIIDALAMLDATMNWHMICVGEDRGVLSGLTSQENRLGLNGKISWIGSSDAINCYLDIADVALLASHEEGFSNFILEAMAAGLPIVATRVGGNAEAIVDGNTGFLVPPRDPAALSTALANLILHDEMRLAMGEAGRRRVEQQFSHHQCVSHYRRLYENLISKERIPLGELFQSESMPT